MSTDRDATRIVRSWLKVEEHEYADRVLDAVFSQLPATPQRRAGWLARRIPLMKNTFRIAAVAAAVVVVAVIGYQFLGGPNAGGPVATPTPEATPTSTPAPAATPTATPQAGLPLGPHILWEGEANGAGPITVTIAAPGWYGDPGGGILVKNDNADPPDGAGMIVFGGDLYVYGDACHWESTTPDTPATTVDELVAALAAQAPRDASEPVDITVDGYAGKAITLHVPDDAVFSDCDGGTFGSWTVSINGAPGLDPYRYHQGPGQIDEVWVLDVDGVVTVLDWAYYAGTPAEDVAELRAIVESAIFGQ